MWTQVEQMVIGLDMIKKKKKKNQGILCLPYFLTTRWQCIVHTEPLNCAVGATTAQKVKADCHKSLCQTPGGDVCSAALQLCSSF